MQETMDRLQDGVHLVVGTPGRVNDMIERMLFPTENIKIFVLDEADKMLSVGFRNEISEIFCCLPKETQVVLASATMPAEVLEVAEVGFSVCCPHPPLPTSPASSVWLFSLFLQMLSFCSNFFFFSFQKFMQNPVKILVKHEGLTLEGIRQFYINVERGFLFFFSLSSSLFPLLFLFFLPLDFLLTVFFFFLLPHSFLSQKTGNWTPSLTFMTSSLSANLSFSAILVVK